MLLKKEKCRKPGERDTDEGFLKLLWCIENPGTADLCFPALLLLVVLLWARKRRRNQGVAAPGRCNELAHLSSPERTSFLTNTEDTSPSR